MKRLPFLLLLLAAPLRAEDLTEKGLPQAAQEIADAAVAVAAEEGGLKIAVGEFVFAGAGTFNTQAPIQEELIRALAGHYDEDGTVKIIGTYGRHGADVEIKAQITRTDGKNLKNSTANFKDRTASVTKITDQMRLIPGSKAIPPHTPADPKDEKPKPKDRADAAAKPSTAFVRDGTRVQSFRDSLYAVEIRTKAVLRGAATPLTATVKNGEASVPEIPVGVLYEIRLLNYGKQEVSADVSIDGLNEFHFTADRKKDGTPAYSGSLVPPAVGDTPGEAVILGWYDHFDTKEKEHHFQSFLVTEFGKGAISKLPNAPRGKVGVVSVAFSLSFPVGTQRSGGETGNGPPDKQKGDVVQRVADPPHEFVAIRYQRPQGPKK